jgi:cytochrome c oxidase subunit IV
MAEQVVETILVVMVVQMVLVVAAMVDMVAETLAMAAVAVPTGAVEVRHIMMAAEQQVHLAEAMAPWAVYVLYGQAIQDNSQQLVWAHHNK